MADGPCGSLVAAPPVSCDLMGWQWGQEVMPLLLGAGLGDRRRYSWPVYWPRKETLSGRLPLPAPLVPSREARGPSWVFLFFPDDSWGEAGSASKLRDSRGTSRGTEEDLARSLPAGSWVLSGSPDNRSVDLLPQWEPQVAEEAAGRSQVRAGWSQAGVGHVGPWCGRCRLSSSRRRSRDTSACSSRMAWSRPVLERRRLGVVS